MINRLNPFFTYFGGKWRVARHYPKPRFSTIIDPFAGAAGFSLHYPAFRVNIYDADPTICAVWDYLIKAPRSEILKLPLKVGRRKSTPGMPRSALAYRFLAKQGSVGPRNLPSKWMRDGTCPNSFWGEVIRERIANQVPQIRHWTIENKSYADIKDRPAHWFVDPPYERSGVLYKYNKVDYAHLAWWCMNRPGDTVVCEQDGAKWLPFEPFREIIALRGPRGSKTSKEVIWINEPK